MSVLTSTRLRVAPSAAACISVVGGTPAWTFGSWVQMLAATGGVAQIAGIVIGVNSAGAGVEYELEIGTGGAGAETSIGRFRDRIPSGGNGGPSLYLLPAPIDNVPSGARLSCRVRTDNVLETIAFALVYYEGLDSDHETAALLNAAPAAANSVSLTPSGTAWNNSPWVELVSSLADESALVAIAWSQPVASVDVEFDLGTGGAGAETVVTTLRGAVMAANGGRIGLLTLSVLFPLAAGQRVAVRMRKTGTSTSAHLVALLYYGGVALLSPPPEPVVETLAATAIRSTQTRLRGRIDPNGFAMTGWFEWGIAGSPLALDTSTSAQAVGNGTLFVTYSDLLTGLEPNTTYYYRAVGNDGTDDFFGEILSFTTAGEHQFIDGEVSYPLAWLELTKRDGNMTPFAEVDLNDAPDYYGGYKAPWVTRFHGITRGLSDRVGEIEHLAFGAHFGDTANRYFRALLDDPVNQYLTNRPLVERFIDDEDRRIEGLPRIAAVGYVNDYAPDEDLQFDLKGADWLKKKFSRKRKAQQSWQPLVTAEDFPNCPEETLNTAAPIIYGPLGLTGADPVENVTITVNAQPTAAPGAFAISTVAGGQYAGVTRYYKVAGIVGGQETIQAGPLSATTDNTNRTIRLTWTAVPGATAIIVYSSHRADFAQFYYQELAGGATTFDDSTTPIDDANRAPWNLGLRLNLTYYVYAKLAGGVLSRPGVATQSVMPIPYDEALQDRDIDIAWSAHPSEIGGYLVLRHRSYYSSWNPRFDRQWDLATGTLTVTDDVVTTTAVSVPSGELVAAAAAGQVEARFVGTMSFGSPGQLLNVGLIARHACSRVGKIYLPVTVENVDGETETTYEPIADGEYGSTWFAPDHSGWLYSDKFVDINGRRYTLIATTVTPWPDKVLVDVDGVEEDGDGNGALIRSLVRQRLHFVNNFIAPDTPWQSGVYLTAADTTFPHIPDLPLVDEQSHLDVEAMLEERIAGGYEGAGIIGAGGEFVSATAALAQFHVSGDFDQTFNRKGQDSISAEPIAAAVDPPSITDVVNIRDGSFRLSDQVQTAFFNLLPYVHTRDYTGRTAGGWYGVGEERSQTSIDNYDQERESPRFELHFLRANTTQGAATIVDVMARKRARYKTPRRVGTLTMPFEGLNYEPGSVATIDAIEGIGANGWVGREVRFTHHEAYPTEGYIVLDFYDLAAVFANQGSPA